MRLGQNLSFWMITNLTIHFPLFAKLNEKLFIFQVSPCLLNQMQVNGKSLRVMKAAWELDRQAQWLREREVCWCLMNVFYCQRLVIDHVLPLASCPWWPLGPYSGVLSSSGSMFVRKLLCYPYRFILREFLPKFFSHQSFAFGRVFSQSFLR